MSHPLKNEVLKMQKQPILANPNNFGTLSCSRALDHPNLGPKFGPIQKKIPNLTKPTWSQKTTDVSVEKTYKSALIINLIFPEERPTSFLNDLFVRALCRKGTF